MTYSRFLQAAHHSGAGNPPITRLVVHCTVSPCVRGQAWSTALYFARASSGGSAHHCLDPGENVGCLHDQYIGWHAPPNGRSKGYEICDPIVGRDGKELPASRWFDEAHTATLRITAAQVREDCIKYGIPMRKLSVTEVRAGAKGICGHVDVSKAFGQSSHWDPGVGFPWDHFMALVNDGQPPPPPPPPPTKQGKAKGMIVIGQPERGIWVIDGGFANHLSGPQWAQFKGYLVDSGIVPVANIPGGGAGPAAFEEIFSSVVNQNHSRALLDVAVNEPLFFPEELVWQADAHEKLGEESLEGE